MITLIAAIGRNRELGKNGGMIWHLPEDLKFFKRTTMGHPVIMGRKTWESLPGGALPGRRNIVVTRTPGYSAPGAETCGSLQEALALAAGEEPFVLGGASVYEQAMPLADRLVITHIDAADPAADAYFPPISPLRWRPASSTSSSLTPGLTFTEYLRK